MYSNNGQYEIRLKNDQTVRQTGLSRMMYNANDARWYSGYSNSLTFNAPWIRVDVCPNTPGACGLSDTEWSAPELLLVPNPGADGFRVSESGRVTVRDLFGRVCIEQNIEAQSWLDASGWASGIYLIDVNGRVQRWVKL
jgi:hypothetical protein